LRSLLPLVLLIQLPQVAIAREDGTLLHPRGAGAQRSGPGAVTDRIGAADAFATVAAALAAAAPSSRDQVAGVVRARDFGAVCNGSADDTAAVLASLSTAMSAAAYNVNVRVELPSGDCLVTMANLLGSFSAPTAQRAWLTIAGAGTWATKLTYRPRTPDTYLYDGTIAKQLQFLIVRDLTIVADDSVAAGPVNLFRQNGAGANPDQGYQFLDVWFHGPRAHPSTLLRIEGALNGSENRFINCRGYWWKSVLSVANGQAVNQYVIGCDWELTQGDVFYFEGGGQLTVMGGSIILASGGNAGAGGSVLRIKSPRAGNTSAFNFIGIRTEVYDAAAKLFHLTGPNLGALVNVVGSSFRTLNAGDAVLARINSYSNVALTFTGCDLMPSANRLGVEFENTQGVAKWYQASAAGGRVVVERSHVAADMASQVSWHAHAEGGLFRMRSCTTPAVPVSNGAPALALDVDRTSADHSWQAARNDNVREVKSVSGFVSYWPSVARTNHGAVQLPVGSIVKSIRIRKAARGGDSSLYQLKATNDNNSYTYGESKVAKRSDQHDIMLENVNRFVSSPGADQVVRVTCVVCGDDVVESMSPGDLFVVEYY